MGQGLARRMDGRTGQGLAKRMDGRASQGLAKGADGKADTGTGRGMGKRRDKGATEVTIQSTAVDAGEEHPQIWQKTRHPYCKTAVRQGEKRRQSFDRHRVALAGLHVSSPLTLTPEKPRRLGFPKVEACLSFFPSYCSGKKWKMEGKGRDRGVFPPHFLSHPQ